MKKLIKINLLIILILTAMSTKTHAALTSKPATAANANGVVVNSSIANSYVRCKEMLNSGESLYGATVEPHLATNKDWGAVSYLSNSIYGTNSEGKNTGVEVTINGIRYYSTNGNASGVMNWGINPYKTLYTQTAGLISNYTEGNNNLDALYTDRETNFVEFINPNTYSLTKGMAMQETSGLYVTFYQGTSTSYPGSIRLGLFEGLFGLNGYGSRASGAAYNDVTFRPVI